MLVRKSSATATPAASPLHDTVAIRRRYADRVMRLADVRDARVRNTFASVPREDFLPPPPWKILPTRLICGFTTSNPRHLYRNVLVAIDASRGINNGEPALHAAWLDAVSPQPGEAACHVGAGSGYYTAMLAELVGPGGEVEAFEIVPEIAAMAARNLDGYANVRVHAADADRLEADRFDVIYVNAAAAAPPVHWIDALRPGGRLIFPWRPSADVALAMLIRRENTGFSTRPLMGAWFIPLAGAGANGQASRLPDREEAMRIRSLVMRRDRAPDDSALAVFDDLWFSSLPVSD
jgi:protein-L-isoaspartate(D-aspartate) O-methyltransferase